MRNYFWKNNVFTLLVCCLYSSLGFYFNMCCVLPLQICNKLAKEIATPFVFFCHFKAVRYHRYLWFFVPACIFPHTYPQAVQRSFSNEKHGFLDHVKIQFAYYIKNLHLVFLTTPIQCWFSALWLFSLWCITVSLVQLVWVVSACWGTL